MPEGGALWVLGGGAVTRVSTLERSKSTVVCMDAREGILDAGEIRGGNGISADEVAKVHGGEQGFNPVPGDVANKVKC